MQSTPFDRYDMQSTGCRKDGVPGSEAKRMAPQVKREFHSTWKLIRIIESGSNRL